MTTETNDTAEEERKIHRLRTLLSAYVGHDLEATIQGQPFRGPVSRVEAKDEGGPCVTFHFEWLVEGVAGPHPWRQQKRTLRKNVFLSYEDLRMLTIQEEDAALKLLLTDGSLIIIWPHGDNIAHDATALHY